MKKMDKKDIFKMVDHTQLKAFADYPAIKKLCDEAVENNMASVCIPPSYVKRVKEEYKDSLKICTVIGFPLGYNTTEVKVFETKAAIRDGADEVDIVINIGDVKNNDFDKIKAELTAVREASEGSILKVIIETCYLTEEEKIKMCKIVTEVKADFIKTSTGFGSSGATLSDIDLFKQNISPEVKIKPAGGIRTREDFISYAESGCARIGASAALTAFNAE